MITEPANHSPIVQAPLFPPYADVEHAIRLLDGEPVKRVREMMKAIYEQAGTPQSPVDWSEPDIWIDERLTGDFRTLARKVWDGSGKTLNPRYLYGCYLFINRLNLSRILPVLRTCERVRACSTLRRRPRYTSHDVASFEQWRCLTMRRVLSAQAPRR
jgi:hypothetical protein